jgi:hypothetical protein
MNGKDRQRIDPLAISQKREDNFRFAAGLFDQ